MLDGIIGSGVFVVVIHIDTVLNDTCLFTPLLTKSNHVMYNHTREFYKSLESEYFICYFYFWHHKCLIREKKAFVIVISHQHTEKCKVTYRVRPKQF